MGEHEETHGIAQIECLKEGRMFPEHLVSMSEDIGKEEHFAALRFMAHTAKKKNFSLSILTLLSQDTYLKKRAAKLSDFMLKM